MHDLHMQICGAFLSSIFGIHYGHVSIVNQWVVNLLSCYGTAVQEVCFNSCQYANTDDTLSSHLRV